MVAVIGDVHGCYYTLQTLVDKIRSKYPLITLYCVGDLVDRGNYSVEVIEYLKNENIQFTKGNHDMMFLAYYREPFSSMEKTGCKTVQVIQLKVMNRIWKNGKNILI